MRCAPVRPSLLIVALCAALAPASAWAFPFIVAGAGAGALPLAMAAAAVLARWRWLAPLAALVSVAGALLWPAQPQAYRDRMRTDARVLESVVEESRLPQLLRLPPVDPARSLTYAQALSEGTPMLWVDRTPALGQRGLTLAELAARPPPLAADTLLLSDSSGDAARHAAALTGLRWIAGGLAGIELAQPPTAPADVSVQAALPDCRYPQCLRVGVLMSHQIVWNGYARGLVDRSLRIEDFLLPGRSPRELLRELSRDGAIPVHVLIFGTSDVGSNLRWSHLIRPHLPGGFTLLRDVAVANDLTLREQMESYIGPHQPDLPSWEVARGCARGDTLLVTPLHPRWQRVVRLPGALADCPVVHLPVEGLVPEEVKAFVQQRQQELGSRLGTQRIVGLYLDETDQYALSLLRDALRQAGFAWAGQSFGYDGAAPGPLAPAGQAADRLLESLRPHLANERGATSAPILALALGGPLGLLGLGFARARGRALASLLFLALLLYAAFWLHAWQRMPLTPGTVFAPEAIAHTALLVVFALTAVLAWWWQVQRTQDWSKSGGLERLRRWGLQVPPSCVLRRADDARFIRAARQLGPRVIFRSDEAVHENREAHTMGAHQSVVVHGVPDAQALGALQAGWQDMAREPGTRPAFLVQPWFEFESCGVVRTGLMNDGRAQVRVERADTAEGVTGNHSARADSLTLDVETCACSPDPLLQDIARIHAHHPGPLLLEFGLLQGRPVWLQMQRLVDSPVLLHEEAAEAGFMPSPLQYEFDADSRGLAFVVSLLDASVPGRRWRLQGRRVVEQPTALASLWTLAARSLPWTLLLRASAALLHRSRERWMVGSAHLDTRSLAWAKAVLMLDGLLLLKGRSACFRTSEPDAVVTRELAAIVSPYGQFAELAALTPAPATAPASASRPCARRLRSSFLAREQLRQALCYALAPLSSALQQRLAQQAFAPRSLDALTLADVDWATGEVHPHPALAQQDGTASTGLRQPGTVQLHIERADDIEHARSALAGVRDATVVAARPWLGLFALAPHTACFQIGAVVHRNSHFMQRACALGIAVNAQPLPADSLQPTP